VYPTGPHAVTVSDDAPERPVEVARRRISAEAGLVLLLGLAVLAVHNVGYMLSQPFWNDEAWVAVTTKFPLSQLRETTSSTPIGWSFLLRFITVSGTETPRLLALAFAGLAVVAAYWLGRGLGWGSRPSAILAGTLAGLGALLVPAMLQRDDLKQYTADACMALLVLALTSWLEKEWSRRRLMLLSVAVWGGMLVSDVVAFVGIAAFAAVCLAQLARRDWRKLVEALVAGAGTAVLMGAVYEVFDKGAADILAGSTHWDGYYVPISEGLHASLAWIIMMTGRLRPDYGLGPIWLAVPLVAAGVVTIGRLGRPATALAAGALLPEMVVMSALKIYPYGDPRTSTALMTVIMVVAAIGVAGICALLYNRLPRRAVAVAAAAVVIVAALTAGSVVSKPYVRGRTIPTEDISQQTRYVAAHVRPADVVLVNSSSNWGFAYYWPYGHPARRLTDVNRQGYLAYFPGQRVVVAPDRNLTGVTEGLQDALRLIRPGSCARIWLVRTHVSTQEQAAWTLALGRAHLVAVPVGHDGLSAIMPGSSACA
jgi:hypothetical protein